VWIRRNYPVSHFADDTFSVSDIPDDLYIDHAFECVGGAASQQAINQIIDHIQPEGTISILGVSEYPVPINTRMVLGKRPAKFLEAAEAAEKIS